jgi:hypothetical protein
MNILNTQANIFKVNGGIADEIANRPLATNSYYIFWATDTGEIYYDNGSWIQFGGGGIPFFYITTYNDLNSLRVTSSLIPGATYFVNDINLYIPYLNSIIVKAESAQVISDSATTLQYCPKSYSIGAMPNFIGMWRSTLTPAINDTVIWGAKVFRNKTGNVGFDNSNYDLDSINWEFISFTDTNFYAIKNFEVLFDFVNIRIYQQSDRFGNFCKTNTFGPNSCVANDWNQLIYFNNNIELFINNIATGIQNNNCRTVNYNTLSGSMFNNIVYEINNNTCSTLYQNNCNNIQSNICVNEISLNRCNVYQNVALAINQNTNSGEIYFNNISGNIFRNTNAGNINNNSNGGNIELNSNNGSITANTNTNAIRSNKNNGVIQNNGSNVTLIEHNGNTGSILGNNNNGTILHNNNNGNIANNTCLAITNNYCGGNLSNNSNIGNISGNNIGGPITGNSNAGQIFQNINTAGIQNNSNNGQIYRNMNNGQILGITAPTGQIFSNVNNGDILISTPGNITDPIVNK